MSNTWVEKLISLSRARDERSGFLAASLGYCTYRRCLSRDGHPTSPLCLCRPCASYYERLLETSIYLTASLTLFVEVRPCSRSKKPCKRETGSRARFLALTWSRGSAWLLNATITTQMLSLRLAVRAWPIDRSRFNRLVILYNNYIARRCASEERASRRRKCRAIRESREAKRESSDFARRVLRNRHEKRGRRTSRSRNPDLSIEKLDVPQTR